MADRHPKGSRRVGDDATVTELVEERIVVGCHSVRLLRPVDAEALVDERAFDDDEFLPYWAEVWPAGLALAGIVAELGLDGVRVLELGCGLALPSLVAAARGADVVASDWSAEAIALVDRNAQANGVDVRAELVRWDDPGVLAGAAFDLVLAADVLYESRNTARLLAALDRLVAGHGHALVLDPGRRHAHGFATAARSAGWCVATSVPPGLPRGTLFRLGRG